MQMRKWLHLISDLDLFPPTFGYDWRYLFVQPTEGDATIIPRFQWCVHHGHINSTNHD
jgi:hypothetical protein